MTTIVVVEPRAHSRAPLRELRQRPINSLKTINRLMDDGTDGLIVSLHAMNSALPEQTRLKGKFSLW
jgi:hypothetical protein